MNEKFTYIVTYRDLFLGADRSRTHAELESALQFIKFRACMPELYNHFCLNVQKETEQ
jgi:hypothetical protein